MRDAGKRIARFATREREILSMLAGDCSRGEIVSRLQLARPDFEVSRALILQLLGVDSVAAALAIAFAARASD